MQKALARLLHTPGQPTEPQTPTTASTMRILIFGASGRTGQIVQRIAAAAGHHTLTPAHADCPLENTHQLSNYVLTSNADLIINCAAISNIETCAADPLQAHLINALAPATMALACRHTGARFIHLSTDYVLDGRRPGIRNESAKCRPINCYAETKREGEYQTLEANPAAIIARVSWVCGNPARPSFIESTLTRALAGQPLAAVADKYSLPTAAADIARAALHLATTEHRGVIHLTSSGAPLSWWHCATLALQAAVQQGALAEAPAIQQQQLDSVPFFREPRPRHTAMDNTLLTTTLGIPMPTAEQTIHAAVAAHVSQRFCRD